MSLNRVVVVGRLTKDPETKRSQSGDIFATFSVAFNDRYSKENVNFFDCVCFRQTAEYVGQYLKKGDLIGVDGRLQQDTYENKQGFKVSQVKIIAESVQSYQAKPSEEKAQPDVAPKVDDNDLPF